MSNTKQSEVFLAMWKLSSRRRCHQRSIASALLSQMGLVLLRPAEQNRSNGDSQSRVISL